MIYLFVRALMFMKIERKTQQFCNVEFDCSKGGVETRPSSDSEAATMYKLKGQSSNMQTVQSFKNKKLVCLAYPFTDPYSFHK